MQRAESRRLQSLIAALAKAPYPNVCNPYADRDPALDAPNAAAIRLSNLGHYLANHAHACIALIGEAVGYRGGRFTGIPFTCEAQLREWDDARYRTSSLRGDYDERSARCVWQLISQRNDVILWNAFPWHPHQPGQPLTNRQPSRAELRAGTEVLKLFLQWKQPEQMFAVGRIAERALRELDVLATYVRHPSHGGQRAFRSTLNCVLHAEFSTPASDLPTQNSQLKIHN